MEKTLGSSPQAQSLQKLLQQASTTDAPVLIFGERGSGRQFAANLLHTCGSRAGTFETLGCGGLGEAVVVAELAVRIERASGGTLFLDDINELASGAQAALGRHIQENPGINVRIIGACARNLEEFVDAGHFSRALYSQLLGIRVVLAPLRERKADIPILAQEFLRESDARKNRSARNIDGIALRRLTNYSWPGNVRELKDAVERAAATARQDTLRYDDFDFLISTAADSGLGALIPGASIHEIEKEAILRTLEHVGGSTTAAARILKMSVRKVQYKLKKYRKTGEETDQANQAHQEKTRSVSGRA